MLLDLPVVKKLAQPVLIDTGVVGDRGETGHAFAHQRLNQILRYAAQSESADHEHGAILNIANRFVGTGHDFVHKHTILTGG